MNHCRLLDGTCIFLKCVTRVLGTSFQEEILPWSGISGVARVSAAGADLKFAAPQDFCIIPQNFLTTFFCNLPHLPLSCICNSSLKFIYSFQIFLAVPSILPTPIRVPPGADRPPIATPRTGILWRNLGKSSLEERSGLLFSEVSIVYGLHSSFKSFRYIFW